MLGIVVVEEEEDYSNWLAQQMSFEQIMAQKKIKNKTIQLAEK
jgi:heme/copper-type cytochrome/quinol oxidase subunit 2